MPEPAPPKPASPKPAPPKTAPPYRLRILATSDIHADFVGHDYVRDSAANGQGLVKLAPLIRAARTAMQDQGGAVVLLDNGDILQGTALGVHLAEQPVTEKHPVLQALAHLEYDALGIGNHDLDFGVDYLGALAAQSTVPFLSSNLSILPGVLGDDLLVAKQVSGADGTARTLTVGIISLLPSETALWNRQDLPNTAQVAMPLDNLRQRVPQLHARGADLVIVLAHMGIGSDPIQSLGDKGATLAAQITGVDAVIAGHTHRRFPGPDHQGQPLVDTERGTIAGTPVVMPANSAAALGVIDLDLVHDAQTGWTVTGHAVSLQSPPADQPPDAAIMDIFAPFHTACRSRLTRRIGDTPIRLHSYFARIQPCPCTTLIAAAQARMVADLLVDTEWADLPLLSSTAMHTAGGRMGPEHFIDIPKGPLHERHIHWLCPYPNPVWAVCATGFQIHQWLEHSARIFNQLDPDAAPRPLINPNIPGFQCDSIFGLTYTIDPTAPVGHRIHNIRHQGLLLEPDTAVIVATNPYRVNGSGGFFAFNDGQVVLRSKTLIQEALRAHVARPDWHLSNAPLPWRLACAKPLKTIAETAPCALELLDDLGFDCTPLDQPAPDGALRLLITLPDQ